MPSTAHNLPLNRRANTAAADPKCAAVALTGVPAAIMSFQWQHPTAPPTKNVDSAISHSLAAVQFGGNSA